MSQKFKKLQNQNDDSAAFGKWFATAVYDQHFITTEELAEFIQTQASVKKSDIKAVLDELGGALKHFFELGQKVKLDGIGIFKVGFSSIGTNKKEDCGAQNITTRRVLFQPETERVVVGQEKRDRACGRRSGEEGRQGKAEVRRRQDAGEGCRLRGDLRYLAEAGE